MDIAAQETEDSTKERLSFWPTPQDYNEALQNPDISFADPELKVGVAATNALGLPRPISGAFASVYQMNCGERTYAVRCFLHNVRDQQLRYELISNYIMSDDLPYTVTCHFQPNGIQIHGRWFPVLKMEWVEGQTLDRYIESHLNNRAELASLRDRFVTMCQALKECDIAHGDLQHGNIMVLPNGELRLVDYDGIFVPAMTGMQSNELGHRNYQHPLRSARNFDSTLDTFASWVIHLSLTAVAEYPEIYGRLSAGSDCLLFRAKDFKDVWGSEAFALIESLGCHHLNELSNSLKWLATSQQNSHLPLGSRAPSCNRPAIISTDGSPATSDRTIAVGDPTDVDQWWHNYLSNDGSMMFSGPIEPELTGRRPRTPVQSDPSSVYPRDTIVLNGLLTIMVLPILRITNIISPLVTIAVLVFAVLATYLIIRRHLKCRTLVMNGLAAPGKILRKEVVKHEDEGSVTYTYRLHYHYPAKNKDEQIEIYQSSQDCPKEVFYKFADGEHTTVLHDENTPNKSIIYKLSTYRPM